MDRLLALAQWMVTEHPLTAYHILNEVEARACDPIALVRNGGGEGTAQEHTACEVAIYHADIVAGIVNMHGGRTIPITGTHSPYR